MAATAGTASAATFYVNQRGSSSTCSGRGALACETVNEAVAQAEKETGPNTIEIESGLLPEEGVYKESVTLANLPNLKGLTIDGAEAGIVIEGSEGKPGLSTSVHGGVTLSNLTVKASKAGVTPHSALADKGSVLALDNVLVDNESKLGNNGIEAEKSGSVSMNGGGVTMENGASGYGVRAIETPLALNGVTILTAKTGEAGGVGSERGSLSMTNSNVFVETELKALDEGIFAFKDGVSLQNVSLRQMAPEAPSLVLDSSPAAVNGLSVEMLNPTNIFPAVESGHEGNESATFAHLQVSGTWAGSALGWGRSDLTLSDSRLVTAGPNDPVVTYGELSPVSRGLLIQRSILQAAPNAPEVLFTGETNVTVDSSEILGGTVGTVFEDHFGGAYTFTLAGSTLDAGAAGIAGDAPGVSGIEAVAKGTAGAALNVSVQGSIVLEKQVASAGTGGQANIGCAYSATPSQAEASGGGAINCAAGAGGNTDVNPLSTLFPEPFSGSDYNLSPSSSAVSSVPPGAISLPFGLNPSATDLAGNPRSGDGVDACFTAQDKGALELQGHLVSCSLPQLPGPAPGPGPGPSKPFAGVISALSISPKAFAAAPSGATISLAAASKKKGKKYGATISYRDSQIATTTFTVLREESGRTQGKSCKKPSKSNRHGKRCTLYAPIGTFSHSDLAGANSLHFSGRLNGRKLAKGRYRLSAVAHNSAGAGPVATREFKITG
jgi:hypothetical protein